MLSIGDAEIGAVDRDDLLGRKALDVASEERHAGPADLEPRLRHLVDAARHHHEHPAGDRALVGLRDERHVEPELRRGHRRPRLRVKTAGRCQRDNRQGGTDRAGGQPSD